MARTLNLPAKAGRKSQYPVDEWMTPEPTYISDASLDFLTGIEAVRTYLKLRAQREGKISHVELTDQTRENRRGMARPVYAVWGHDQTIEGMRECNACRARAPKPDERLMLVEAGFDPPIVRMLGEYIDAFDRMVAEGSEDPNEFLTDLDAEAEADLDALASGEGDEPWPFDSENPDQANTAKVEAWS